MKRGRQEEIIKQRKDTYGGVGGDREGKMTYLGYTACSEILHPPCPAHTLQVPSEVNPPAFPPLCAVTALLPLLQLVCMFARVCMCVCHHFFFFLTFQCGAERQWAQLPRDRTRNLTQNIIGRKL